jgi:antitoxin ParD1/3/4
MPPGKTQQMNISLTPRLASFVRASVRSGLYNNASEVMREALRHMQEGTNQEKATHAKVKASAAAVANGEYNDYSPAELRKLVRSIIAEIGTERKTPRGRA